MRELIKADTDVKSETAETCDDIEAGKRLSPTETTYFKKERPAIETMGWRDMVIAARALERPACRRILSIVAL